MAKKKKRNNTELGNQKSSYYTNSSYSKNGVQPKGNANQNYKKRKR